MANKLHLKIDCGSTFRRQLVIRDQEGKRIPISASNAKLTVRDRIGGFEIFSLTTQGGDIRVEQDDVQLGEIIVQGRVIPGEEEPSNTGVISFIFSNELTANVTATQGVYDLKVVHANGDSTRYIEGIVAFDPAVTL